MANNRNALKAAFQKMSSLMEVQIEKQKKSSSNINRQMDQTAEIFKNEISDNLWFLEAIDRLDQSTELYQRCKTLGIIGSIRSRVSTLVCQNLKSRNQLASLSEGYKEQLEQIEQTIFV